MKYKLFGRSGLRVSEVCLGTMTFGEDWGKGANFQESVKQYEHFRKLGGNFFDTANRYTEGTSERFLGECIKGEREQVVVATKYSLYTQKGSINDGGNHRKNMVQSLEGSLQRLKTEYVDILFLHMWDFTTRIDEVMRGLDDLVRSGKVLYIAISDTPAWVVSSANTMADLRGWTAFSGLQIEYNLIKRDGEREFLPMAESLDLAVTAWAPIAGGVLTGKYLQPVDSNVRVSPNSPRLSERNTAIVKRLVELAKENSCTPAQLALRWLMEKSPRLIPIIGARSFTQLEETLGVIDVAVEKEVLDELTSLSVIDLGFPHDFLQQDLVNELLFGGLKTQFTNHRK